MRLNIKKRKKKSLRLNKNRIKKPEEPEQGWLDGDTTWQETCGLFIITIIIGVNVTLVDKNSTFWSLTPMLISYYFYWRLWSAHEQKNQ